MLTQEQLMRKRVALDNDTLQNIHNLIKERKKRNLTLKELSIKTGINESTLTKYENGTYLPSLGNYIILTNFFGWDTENNPNYIFFQKYSFSRIIKELHKKKKRYGFEHKEISELLHISIRSSVNIFNGLKNASPNLFTEVLNLFEDEKKREQIRNELIKKVKCET